MPVIIFAFFTYGSAIATRAYMGEASAQAGTALRLAVSALSGHLNRYEALPALIADHDDIKELVSAPEDAVLRDAANLYLKEINGLLKSSDIYVVKPDGETIAASNYDGPGSFVGQNFSYRPYFQDAIEGRQARFYALGTTSLKRGYYFSAPIRVEADIRGVIVFKVDIDMIEASWGGGEYKIFVSDPEGIIFMSGSPEWLYGAILPLTADRIARTEASRRYANARLTELPVSRQRFEPHVLHPASARLFRADGARARICAGAVFYRVHRLLRIAKDERVLRDHSFAAADGLFGCGFQLWPRPAVRALRSVDPILRR